MSSSYPYENSRVNELIEKWRSGLATFQEGRELSAALDFRVKYILGKIKVPASYDETDFISVGLTAALECAERWEPDQGDFMTFSFARIRGAMYDYLRKQDSVSRPSRAIIGEVHTATRKIEQVMGRDARVSDISDTTGISVDDIRKAMRAQLSRETVSLFITVSEDDDNTDLIEIIEDEETSNEMDMLSADLEFALNTLSDRSRMILFDFYMRDMSQRDIAARHGLTEARISQIRQSSLAKMRKYLTDIMPKDS